MPHSTLGYERRFNWAFKARSEDAFVANVLAGQPDPPKYFATMKRLNKEGPRILGCICTPRRLGDEALASVVAGGALVIDLRPAADYAAGFLPGTLNLALNASLVTWAGWLVPYTQDIYLLFGEGAEARLEEAVRALALIGLDRVAGYFTESALRAVAPASLGRITQVTPHELSGEAGTVTILDVRTDHEWNEGHIAGARHIPLGHLVDRVAEIPNGRPVVTHCQLGGRSAIAASLLTRAGFDDVRNLTGGIEAWKEAKLPVDRSGGPSGAPGRG